MVILWASVGFCTTYVDNLTTIPHRVFSIPKTAGDCKEKFPCPGKGSTVVFPAFS